MTAALLSTIAEVRQAAAKARRGGAAVGLVPTMGALHAGHGALIEKARGECGFTVVSVFVNPIQFDRGDDYERYPRTLAADREFCGGLGVDAVFAPGMEEMYPRPQLTFVEVPALSAGLCGAFRPGHFRGVATVVAKLLHIVQPDRAYFGEKDAQQLAVIERMVSDLNLPVTIVPVPTVREADGLALSSRNRRLSAQEREAAPLLYRALLAAAEAIQGGCSSGEAVKRNALAVLDGEPRIRVEYLEVVDPGTLEPAAAITGPVRVLVAAWLGETRLIDNLLCAPGH
ncbi:MAG: pantoate--beta-alanine ligase [Bryobacterales bacterium]|nr:pantoate--beta-alanine ligase [Bryobacterales bacterium]